MEPDRENKREAQPTARTAGGHGGDRVHHILQPPPSRRDGRVPTARPSLAWRLTGAYNYPSTSGGHAHVHTAASHVASARQLG